jgi:hypothetical protein
MADSADPPVYPAEYVDKGFVQVYNNVCCHGIDDAAL